MWACAVLTVVAIAVWVAGPTADWAGDLARKAVGRAAREGLEAALKDEALDATLDAAGRTVAWAESERLERYEREAVGEAVTTGVEMAMRASGVADALDDTADVAETLQKVNRIRKAIR
jgi:hypothetical protein